LKKKWQFLLFENILDVVVNLAFAAILDFLSDVFYEEEMVSKVLWKFWMKFDFRFSGGRVLIVICLL